MVNFEDLKDKKVEKLYLLVWPPLGEEKLLDIDMSIGIAFENEAKSILTISISKEDMWSPLINFDKTPFQEYSWSQFKTRINSWMESKEKDDLHLEYYNVTNSDKFENIVGKKIKTIHLLSVKDKVFGIRLNFKNDFILITPISDGSTVETSRFNNNNNILNFERIGTVDTKEV